MWADHDRLEQVFVNLLENAFPPQSSRCTRDRRRPCRREPGGPKPGTQNQGNQNQGTETRDTVRSGSATTVPGITPDLAAHIFEPRARGDGRSTGAGLGLSIARGIVAGPRRRDHAWRTPGGGRVSWCGYRSKGGATMSDIEKRTKALLVEDDPNIVDLVRSNLAVRGFDTSVSLDGARALELVETESPDIVLLDLMLPEIDGFELCRQMRERSTVGIIVVSARGGQQDKVAALNFGADDYMTKPFGIEELLARITATLAAYPPGRASGSVPSSDRSRGPGYRPRYAPRHPGRRGGPPDPYGVRPSA